jgi:hypothetical protein
MPRWAVMKKSRYLIVVGLSLAVLGAFLVLVTMNQTAPPVDVQLDQSGISTVNGLYFDTLSLHNHGPANITVVVVIKNALDNSPRMSDPVQICSGCTATALIEEVQPPQNQSPDQNEIYLNILLHPDYIHVEYLSTLLGAPISFDLIPKFGWIILTCGFAVTIYGFHLSNSSSRKKPKRTKKTILR